MNKFIKTKTYKQFFEFCKACNKDKIISLCYGAAGVGKTESARYYSKWHHINRYIDYYSYRPMPPRPSCSMKNLNNILYTPSLLDQPREVIRSIKDMQRKFNHLKENEIYGDEIPLHARKENRNFAELVIIDEAEKLRSQSLELVREIYDEGKTTFIFIGMPGIEKTLERFPQLYSRVGFVHQFKSLGKTEVEFILNKHSSKLGTEIDENDFTDQEVVAAILRITNGNFRLINRVLKQSLRIMKVNHMTNLTKEIIEAARSCLLIGEK